MVRGRCFQMRFNKLEVEVASNKLKYQAGQNLGIIDGLAVRYRSHCIGEKMTFRILEFFS